MDEFYWEDSGEKGSTVCFSVITKILCTSSFNLTHKRMVADHVALEAQQDCLRCCEEKLHCVCLPLCLHNIKDIVSNNKVLKVEHGGQGVYCKNRRIMTSV